MALDRNANNVERIRRNAQRFRSTGATTAGVSVTAPLVNSGTSLSLSLAASGGLQTSGGTLTVLLADTSLQLAAGGLSVRLKTTPGLTVSTGLGVLLDPTSPGLQLTSGLKVLITGATLSLSAAGLQVANNGIAAGQLGVLTTKGDILTFDTAHNRLAVGSNAQVLVADSTATPGIKWANTGYLLNATTADSTAVANTLTETSFSTSFSIAANTLTAGRVLRLIAGGQYSTTGTPTIRLRLKIGGNIVYDTGAKTLTTVTANAWSVSADMTIRDSVANYVAYGTGAIQPAIQLDPTQKAATLTLSASNLVEVTCQWGTAALANTAIIQSLIAFLL
jgi:hypothetical protein